MASLDARQNAEVRERLEQAKKEKDEADLAALKADVGLPLDDTTTAAKVDIGIGEAFDAAVGDVLAVILTADRLHDEQSAQRRQLHDRLVTRFQSLRGGKMGVDRLPLTDEERAGFDILTNVDPAELDLSITQVASLRAFVDLLKRTF